MLYDFNRFYTGLNGFGCLLVNKIEKETCLTGGRSYFAAGRACDVLKVSEALGGRLVHGFGR